MSLLAFCADLGGTTIKLGAVLDGRVEFAEIEAKALDGLEPRLVDIEREWREAARRLGTDQAPSMVGLALPCVIEPFGNRVLSGFNKYPDAMGLDLEAWARNTFNAPLVIENDAHAALAGEWTHGALRGFDTVAYLGFGTGIGSSVIEQGIPLRGPHGQAGNLAGHLQIDAGGRPCMCGGKGCAEAEAAGWSMPDIAREKPGFEQSTLVEPVTAGSIFRASAKGDPFAMRLTDRAVEVWSALTASMIHAHDPEAVVLSGGILRSEGVFERIRDAALGRLWSGAVKPEIRKGELGSQAALLGMQKLAGFRE